MAVLAMLVLGGLLIAGWWLMRGSPADVQQVSVTRASPLVTPAGVDAAAADGAPNTDAAMVAPARPGSTVVVDVEGRVRHPGIVVLKAGSRVVDALRAAGGARPHVDLTGLNLARQLVDGEQILVGVTPPGGLAASAAATPGAVPGALVNLNTADQATLESLPEVGPVTAQAIMAWREEHGGFTAVDQLLDVD
ncbi:MAG: ComEA family DNA-binding protein, partial [Nocardioidaceae bacterium]|nr:ComEA family DNA-binding protein [Nocardioidaceae bacterium]